MARRVITYNEAFEIIENCKPKEMDLYLEAAAKENAIGIYTEMHNYINDNIVTLDYDVDLFTEAFSWDKSKGFWANIWAWIINVWGAIKNLFLSLFGKNENISKEDAEKLKSTAESASNKVGSADITLDGEGIKEVDEFFKYIKSINEKITENEKKIEDMDLGKKEAKSKKMEYLNELFVKVEKIMQSIIKTKTIIKNSAEATAIRNFLKEIITYCNSYDDIDKDEEEANHVFALTFGALCIYNNILVSLGFCAKNFANANMKVTTATPPGSAAPTVDTNTAEEAIKSAFTLLKVVKDTPSSSGPIFLLFQLASNVMMTILEKKVSNIFGKLGLDEAKANALKADDKKLSDFDTYLTINNGEIVAGTNIKDNYDKIINAYNRVNINNELSLPKFSAKYLFQGDSASIISSEKIKDNSDLGAFDNIDTSSGAAGNAVKTEIDGLKTAIPFLQKFSTTILSFALTRKMSGKELLNKCYAFIALLDKATK